MDRVANILDSIENQAARERLRKMRLETAARELNYVRVMLATGQQPYHGVNQIEADKRHARNRVARTTRQSQRRAAR